MNIPSWFGTFFSIMKRIAPKRMIEKVSPCGARNTEAQDIGLCPFARAFLDPAALPAFLGGHGETPPSLSLDRVQQTQAAS